MLPDGKHYNLAVIALSLLTVLVHMCSICIFHPARTARVSYQPVASIMVVIFLTATAVGIPAGYADADEPEPEPEPEVDPDDLWQHSIVVLRPAEDPNRPNTTTSATTTARSRSATTSRSPGVAPPNRPATQRKNANRVQNAPTPAPTNAPNAKVNPKKKKRIAKVKQAGLRKGRKKNEPPAVPDQQLRHAMSTVFGKLAADFQLFNQRVNFSWPDILVQEIFRYFDLNGDQLITLEEFAALLPLHIDRPAQVVDDPVDPR